MGRSKTLFSNILSAGIFSAGVLGAGLAASGCGVDRDQATSAGALTGPLAPPEKPPVAVEDFFEIGEATSAVLDVLANDYDQENETLTLLSVEAALGGASVEDNQVFYEPARFNGLDTLTYRVGAGADVTQGIAIVDVDHPYSERLIKANPDTFIVESANPQPLPVLSNDVSLSNDFNGSLYDYTQPEIGFLTVVEGALVYTPDPDRVDNFRTRFFYTVAVEDEERGGRYYSRTQVILTSHYRQYLPLVD